MVRRVSARFCQTLPERAIGRKFLSSGDPFVRSCSFASRGPPAPPNYGRLAGWGWLFVCVCVPRVSIAFAVRRSCQLASHSHARSRHFAASFAGLCWLAGWLAAAVAVVVSAATAAFAAAAAAAAATVRWLWCGLFLWLPTWPMLVLSSRSSASGRSRSRSRSRSRRRSYQHNFAPFARPSSSSSSSCAADGQSELTDTHFVVAATKHN